MANKLVFVNILTKIFKKKNTHEKPISLVFYMIYDLNDMLKTEGGIIEMNGETF